MSVSSIAGAVAASTLKPLNMAFSIDQPSSQTMPLKVIDANFNNKVSPVNKKSPNADIGGQESVRTMNHVVEVYNLQGKARTKFMDSNNDVIYQIPTEMVSKMEDLMLKPEISTNTKG